MTNQELNNFAGIIGAQGQVIVADTVFEEVTLEESINGDGGLTLGWNSTGSSGLGVGSTAGGCTLLSPYLPTRNGDGSYRYSPKFSDAMAALGKRLFYKQVNVMAKGDTEATTTCLYSFNYVGVPGTIITALGVAAGCTAILHSVGSEVNGVISVSFDGDTIKSAAQKIADACGVPVWYTSGTIHFGAPAGVSNAVGDYYNTFVVLGGTKNMTKKIVKGNGDVEYAAVTQRLTLDADGSKIGGGTPELTKLLVFDNIFPRVRMRIGQVFERRCYRLDEQGEKIKVGKKTVAGETVDVYDQYAKWYITLENVEGEGAIDQMNLNNLIIDGTTLRLQFLPVIDGGTSPLAGREFELVHFTSETTERQSDDVEDGLSGGGGFTVTAAMAAAGNYYRIVANADASVMLPTTSEGALIPRVGDIVSLVNIAVPESCYAAARVRLLEAGQRASAAYTANTPASYTESYPAGDGGSYTLGQVVGGHIVTNITTNLITGERTVTFGTFAQKGVMSSMIDKIEGVQLSGGGTAKSDEEQNTRQVGTMSQEQWEALAKSGGNRGLVALNRRINDARSSLESLGIDIRNVQIQADESFDIWYGFGTPTASNYPANAWTTDADRDLHVEDIYCDYNREPASGGGRAYKWTKTVINESAIYAWVEITDADTLLALEKISDVAGDGVITGGAEKQQVYLEWRNFIAEYANLYASATTYGLSTSSIYGMMESYLGMLNGMSAPVAGNWDGTTAPAWLSDLSASTKLSDYGCTATIYRTRINNLRSSMTTLQHAIDGKAKEALNRISDICNDELLTMDEKIGLLRDWKGYTLEWLDVYNKSKEQGLLGTYQSPTAIYNYTTSLRILGHFMCGGDVTLTGDIPSVNGPMLWTLYQGSYGDTVSLTNTMPTWLTSSTDNSLSGQKKTIWRAIWSYFFEMKAKALNALTAKAQETANEALERARASKKVFVGTELPDTPYEAGDMWYNPTTKELWACQTGRSTGDSQASDWYLLTRDAYFNTCANALVDFLMAFIESYSSVDFIGDWFEAHPNTTNLPVVIANETASNSVTGIYVYVNADTPQQGSITIDGLTTLPRYSNFSPSIFTTLIDLGITEFTIWNAKPSTGMSMNDILFSRPSFVDKFTAKTIIGGLNIWVYTGEMWKQVHDGTSGLLENYGNHIVAAIFGDEVTPDGFTNYASGLNIQKTFAQLFATAQHTPTDGEGSTAMAALATIIETDANGAPTGVVKVTADKLDLTRGNDENGATGMLSMSTGSLSEQSDREVVSGIDIKQGNNSPNATLRTIVTHPFSDGAQHYERFDGESESVRAWSRVQSSLLMLKGTSANNPGAPAGANPAYKGVTTVSPFKVASRCFEIREYVDEGSGFVKHRYKGAGTHVNPLTLTIDGTAYKVIGGIIVEATEIS